MDRRKKTTRFLKTRTWKSKIGNRLKGRALDICRDYLYGAIDPGWLTRIRGKGVVE